MAPANENRKSRSSTARKGIGWAAVGLEAGIYAAALAIYFVLVLHFLGPWLKSWFDHHRLLYAITALTLMIAQGAGLELLTSFLLRFAQQRLD